jgi:hypothetical protein
MQISKGPGAIDGFPGDYFNTFWRSYISPFSAEKPLQTRPQQSGRVFAYSGPTEECAKAQPVV